MFRGFSTGTNSYSVPAWISFISSKRWIARGQRLGEKLKRPMLFAGLLRLAANLHRGEERWQVASCACLI